MENRLKLAISIILLISSCQTSTASDTCSAKVFKNKLLNLNGVWVVQREKLEFKPILRIAVKNRVVWVSTYGADGFPVKLITTIDRLYLDKPTFRIPFPGNSNDIAHLVTPYHESKFRIEPQLPCSLENRFFVIIENELGIEQEKLQFKKLGSEQN